MKKKLIIGLLSFVMTLSAVLTPVGESISGVLGDKLISAIAETSGDYEYQIYNDGTVGIDRYIGKEINVIIPALIDDKKVTSINAFAFFQNTNIKSVTISKGITYIRYSVFDGCTNLENVSIPDSVTDIGEYSFSGTALVNGQKTDIKYVDNWAVAVDKKATSLTIKEGTVGICVGLFEDNNNLSKISIPESVKYFGDNAFAGTQWLSNRQKENPLVSINGILVDGKTAKGDIVIPNTVNRINHFAFEGCTNIQAITIPNTVNEIGSQAFASCTNITSITLPNSINEIKYRTFSGCNALKSIKIPESVKIIDNEAFASCDSLESVIIPEGVTDIGYETFAFCKKLKSVTIPKSVQNIGNYAFGYYGDNINIGDDCWTWDYVKVPNFKIKCYADTAGEKYAIDNGFDYELISEKPAHTHSYTSKVTKTATCTTTGVKTFTCSCGDSYTETINATGHSYGSWTTSKAATCTTDGTKTRSCTKCSATETASITKLGHSYTASVVKPTCTTQGYTLHKCSTCGNEYKDTYANATGHKFGSWTVTKKATCTAEGKQERKCTICGITESKTIAKTAHTYKKHTTKATLTKNGSIVEKCSVCGAKKSTTVIYYPKTIALAKTSYVYNGKIQKPAVTVKDCKGKVIAKSNYTVTYASGCKNVGKYAVKVTFKGNYSGTKTLAYTIIPKGTNISKLTAGKKSFTAKWVKNATQTTGYQIQYTTDSKFKSGVKTVTIKKNSTVSKTISKLTGGKKYYVRVRTYRTANKVNYFSAWSGAKAVTTKK